VNPEHERRGWIDSIGEGSGAKAQKNTEKKRTRNSRATVRNPEGKILHVKEGKVGARYERGGGRKKHRQKAKGDRKEDVIKSYGFVATELDAGLGRFPTRMEEGMEVRVPLWAGESDRVHRSRTADRREGQKTRLVAPYFTGRCYRMKGGKEKIINREEREKDRQRIPRQLRKARQGSKGISGGRGWAGSPERTSPA